MKRTDKIILNRVKKIITELEPGAKIYLYGSRSKGTNTEISDWDFLILLNSETITPEYEQKIAYLLYDLEFETGEVISPIIYTEKEWNTKHSVTPFYNNVIREGKLI